MRIAILVVAAALTASTAQARQAGPCFTIHGRLSIYNGSLVHRIWPTHSHRLLAVVNRSGDYDESKPPIPPSLQQVFDRDPEARIFAVFRLCPATRGRAGVMQHVYFAGARHIAIVASGH